MSFPTIPEIFNWFNLPEPKLGIKILCPVHKEKTPSFKITKDGNTCYCFGCDINNGLSLLTALAGSYNNAIQTLNNNGYGRETKETLKIENLTFNTRLSTIESECRKAHTNLYFPEFKKKLQYLTDRGLTEKTIKKFKIGISTPNFSLPNFHNRYLIPVYAPTKKDSTTNNLLNLVGRASSASQEPKYINLHQYEGSSLPLGYQYFDHPEQRIWLVEGEFDTISLDQMGHKAITVGGTSPSKLFWQLIKPNANFIVAFDNDEAGKLKTFNFVKQLLKSTLNLTFAIFPIQPPQTKSDANDCLVNDNLNETQYLTLPIWIGSLNEFQKTDIIHQIYLYHSSTQAIKLAKSLKIENPTPHERMIVALLETEYNYFFSEAFGLYNFQFGRYEQTTESELRKLIQEKFPGLIYSAISTIAKRFIDKINIGQYEQEKINMLPKNSIACKNGIVNILTGVLTKYTVRDRIITFIDTNYNPEAIAPKTIQFIREIANDVEDRILALQRMCGQILLGNQSYLQRFYCLIGDADNGKSRFLDSITITLGNKVTVNFDFSQFTNNFGTSSFYGKLLAICPDATVNKIEKTDILKQLTGGDRIRACFKYKTEFFFVPTATIIFSINAIPQFRRLDVALKKRLSAIICERTFAHEDSESAMVAKAKGLLFFKPNPELLEIFEEEKTGYLNWMLEGAKEILSKKGHIPKCKDTILLIKDITYQSSAAWEWWIDAGYAHFRKEGLYRDGISVTQMDLWEEYSRWAKDNGKTSPGDSKWLVNKLLDSNYIFTIKELPHTYKILNLSDTESLPEDEDSEDEESDPQLKAVFF